MSSAFGAVTPWRRFGWVCFGPAGTGCPMSKPPRTGFDAAVSGVARMAVLLAAAIPLSAAVAVDGAADVPAGQAELALLSRGTGPVTASQSFAVPEFGFASQSLGSRISSENLPSGSMPLSAFEMGSFAAAQSPASAQLPVLTRVPSATTAWRLASSPRVSPSSAGPRRPHFVTTVASALADPAFMLVMAIGFVLVGGATYTRNRHRRRIGWGLLPDRRLQVASRVWSLLRLD